MSLKEPWFLFCNFAEVASAYQASLLVVEGSQLAGLVHTNIVSLAAACLDSLCPLLAYNCSASELNLKLYLTDGGYHPVARDLVQVGAQIARAGAFLHGRGLLHRCVSVSKNLKYISIHGSSRFNILNAYHHWKRSNVNVMKFTSHRFNISHQMSKFSGI